MESFAECQWHGAVIPKGWSLSPAEKEKILSTAYPLGAVVPWNREWGDYPPGFVRCDGSQHGHIQTPDLKAEEDLVVYISKVKGT